MTLLQPRTRVTQALPHPSNFRSPEASGCYLGGVREEENPKPQIPRVCARAESPALAFLGLWHQAASGFGFVAGQQRSSLGEREGQGMGALRQTNSWCSSRTEHFVQQGGSAVSPLALGTVPDHCLRRGSQRLRRSTSARPALFRCVDLRRLPCPCLLAHPEAEQ